MNIFSRILLAVYAIFLTVISAITMLVVVKPDLLESIYGYISSDVLQSRAAAIIMFTIALILFILSLTFLLSGFRGSKDKKAVSKHTNIGEIKITLNTIENIALTTSRRLSGVRDSKAYVNKVDDNVEIIISAVVLPDINIPALSQEMQSRVKKSVEECSGIGVNNVKVMIENIYSGATYKSRVE